MFVWRGCNITRVAGLLLPVACCWFTGDPAYVHPSSLAGLQRCVRMLLVRKKTQTPTNG